MFSERGAVEGLSKDIQSLPEQAPIYARLGLSKAQLQDFLSMRRPLKGKDGVWEITVVLSSLSGAVETAVPVPLSSMQFNADLVSYVEEQVAAIPKKEPLRIVVLCPVQDAAPEDAAVLGTILRVYLQERILKRRIEEKAALRSVLSACFWGFVFMLCCQVVRWAADFPNHPTITSTLSEGLLVLGWVALWNPYDRLLFSWWPAVKQSRLVQRIAQAQIVFPPSPFSTIRFGRTNRP